MYLALRTERGASPQLQSAVPLREIMQYDFNTILVCNPETDKLTSRPHWAPENPTYTAAVPTEHCEKVLRTTSTYGIDNKYTWYIFQVAQLPESLLRIGRRTKC